LALAHLNPRGPRTQEVLRLIDEHPGLRAVDLAGHLGRDKLPFKADVRRLKALGLTESLETGYRLSLRGKALMTYLRPRPTIRSARRRARRPPLPGAGPTHRSAVHRSAGRCWRAAAWSAPGSFRPR
jgi:hypothetical protein